MTLFALVLLATAGAILVMDRGRALSADLSLRSLWMAPLALVLQVPVLRGMGTVASRSGLILLSQALLLIFCWRNRRLPAGWILALGFLLNAAVMLTNSGLMPIAPETLAVIRPETTPADWEPGTAHPGSKDIILPASETRLWFLSDIFVIPPPFPLPTAFSPGDVVVLIGFAAFLRGLLASGRGMQGTDLRPGHGAAEKAHPGN